MDLAKIRKKSLQKNNESVGESFVTPGYSSAPAKESLEAISTAPFYTEVESSEKDSLPVNVPSAEAAPLFRATMFQLPASSMTPIEAILAGRTAAGCDVESIINDDVTYDVVEETGIKFLCFRVSDEIYGINIMDIKEIIKPREVTEVPRAPAFVSGILSLRGTIISIIDMRIRLGLAKERQTGKERIIVIKNGNSFCGLFVDEVIQVVQIQRDSIEEAPAVLNGIDRDFVSGIGRSDGRLIIILNLESISDINLY